MLINSSFGSPRLLSPVTVPIVAKETPEVDKTQDTATTQDNTTQDSTQSTTESSAAQETPDQNARADSGAKGPGTEPDGARSEAPVRESDIPARASSESVVLSQAGVGDGVAPSDPSIAEARARRMAEATVQRLRMEDLVRSLTEVKQVSIGGTGAADGETPARSGILQTAEPAELVEAQRTNRLA